MENVSVQSLFSLAGKVALVTGGGRGIGRGMAEGLAAAGADVAIASRDVEACRRSAEEIRRTHGVRSVAFEADVSDADRVRIMVGQVVEELGRVDVLINNSGIFWKAPFVKVTEADWRRMIDVNLTGVYGCSQAVAEHMIGRGEGGRIINVTSLNAFRGGSGVSAYCASKGGVQALTQGLAVELAPHRINVNAIAPGLTETDIHRDRDWANDPEAREQKKKEIPLNEIMTPSDFAGVAVFLSSEASRMVTGQTVVVDGGWTVGM